MKRQLKHYMSVTCITFICHLGYPCHTSYFVVALCTGLSMLFVLKLFFTEVKTRQRRQKDMRHFRCTVLRRFIKTFQFSPLPRIMYQKSPKYILRCFLFVYSLRERGGTAFRNSLCQAHFRPLGASVLLAWVCCTPHGVWAFHLSGPHFVAAVMERWRGRVALVTGASVGIGAAIAKELVRHGMKVAGCARDVEKVKVCDV